jgi:hypothetical protein
MELNKTYKRPYKGTQEQIIKRVNAYCKMHDLLYTNLQVFNGYVTFTGWSNITYEALVEKLVAEKYSVGEESAIQRKAIMNGITDEFRIYNAFVEECKVKAKQFIQERESVLND